MVAPDLELDLALVQVKGLVLEWLVLEWVPHHFRTL